MVNGALCTGVMPSTLPIVAANIKPVVCEGTAISVSGTSTLICPVTVEKNPAGFGVHENGMSQELDPHASRLANQHAASQPVIDIKEFLMLQSAAIQWHTPT
jgi:hypothetical protein